MKRNRVYKFLASIKLAVILFVLFAIILALATYYESAYDTATAHHLVYKSPLFAVFLALFFINIWCSTTIRYPWKPKLLGFVITHVGILVLLLGAAVTMLGGIEGSMVVEEGRYSSRILLNQPVFMVGPEGGALKEIPAEFRWRRPSPTKPARVELGEGLVAVVEEYLHHAALQTHFEASQSGVPALKLRIFMRDQQPGRPKVDQLQWLTAGKGDVSLGPAQVRLLRAADPATLKRLMAAGSHERGELQLLINGEPQQVKITELEVGKPYPVGGYQLLVRRYLPHAVVENNELISKDDQSVNPCIDVQVRDDRGNSQDWLLFARLPELNTRTASKGEMPLRLTYAWAEEGKRGLSFIVGPEDRLYYRLDQKAAQPLEVGKAYPTGWMNLEFEVGEFLTRAQEVREFRAVDVEEPNDPNAPPPAIRLRLEGAPSHVDSFWLERGDIKQVRRADGKEWVVGYAFKSLELGFPLKLVKFHIDYDPGTSNPAAFRSQVEVQGQSHEISMNEPMVRDGFKFFQSSYSQMPDSTPVSIFTVARDPGIWLKYLGSIMVVLGIATMFWMRPYQLGRKRDAAPRESEV